MRERARGAILEHLMKLGPPPKGFRETIEHQRFLFLRDFGPEHLATVPLEELVSTLPHNVANDQPLDHWLEARRDDDFNTLLFGDIRGGPLTKFGVWQDAETGAWRARSKGTNKIAVIEDADALEVLEERRTEMLAAAAVLSAFENMTPDQIDPAVFQAALAESAPHWHGSAWLYKYLHLCAPSLVPCFATQERSRAACYRLGLSPEGEGHFSHGVQVLAFWHAIAPASTLPLWLRYRLGVGLAGRRHWLVTGPKKARAAMLDAGVISAPSKGEGDLSGLLAGRGGITRRVRAALEKAGQTPSRDEVRSLARLLGTAAVGDVVGLTDASMKHVFAVGTITAEYHHDADDTRPHQRAVTWHQREKHALPPVGVLERHVLTSLPSNHAAASWLEASLLASGEGLDALRWPPGPWEHGDALESRPLEAPSEPTGASRTLPHVEGTLSAPTPPVGLLSELMKTLSRKRQLILYGPPGTGKTYHAERLAKTLIAHRNMYTSPEDLTAKDWERLTTSTQEGGAPTLALCTFHPMYAYEDFIEGYRPDGQGGFSLHEGIFQRMARAAAANPSDVYVLVIDEINRGNIPRIFGELITLIEPSKRGQTHATLPLSGRRFTVPENLYLIGTMNTADRSILLLDAALRRRFAFREMMPDPALLSTASVGTLRLSAWLRALNRRIVEQLGRDARNLQVGHAYLMPGGAAVETVEELSAIVRDELWPLLQEYCYEDAEALATILASGRGGIYDPREGRLREALFESGNEPLLLRALEAIITTADRAVDRQRSDAEPPP